MLPHQLRVIDEKCDLDQKIERLTQFIEKNALFEGLDDAEKSRLRIQKCVMESYSTILGERIAAF